MRFHFFLCAQDSKVSADFLHLILFFFFFVFEKLREKKEKYGFGYGDSLQIRSGLEQPRNQNYLSGNVPKLPSGRHERERERD